MKGNYPTVGDINKFVCHDYCIYVKCLLEHLAKKFLDGGKPVQCSNKSWHALVAFHFNSSLMFCAEAATSCISFTG